VLEKLEVLQLGKKFSARVRYFIVSQINPSCTLASSFFKINFYVFHPGLPNGLFLQVFPPKRPCISHVPHTCHMSLPIHPPTLYYCNADGEGCKRSSCSLRHFLQPAVTFTFQKQVQYVPQHCIPKHSQLYSSLNVKDAVPCPYETIFTINIVFYNLHFCRLRFQ
jgi:hypothetical protein